MSGFRSQKSEAGAKASGPGSTHQRAGKPRSAAGAKASGGMHGTSTHEGLSPDRRSKPGAKASQGAGSSSLVDSGQAVSDPTGRASEQRKPGGRSVAHPHGSEMVSEHHRK